MLITAEIKLLNLSLQAQLCHCRAYVIVFALIHVLIVGRCSYSSIASLGIVFEIKEVRSLPWNIAPGWLWNGFLRQDTEAGCEFLSWSELSC